MVSTAETLRVTLDVRMARHSGIGRYIRDLYRELEQPELRVELRLLGPRGPLPEPFDRPDSVRVRFEAPIYSLREQWQGSWICLKKNDRTGVWHFPHYNAPWMLPPNSVVTVHDLTHFTEPGGRSPLRVALARTLLSRVVRRAGRLITVSAATRELLEAAFPVARGKTCVVHNAVARTFRPLDMHGVRQRLEDKAKGGPTLLYVGNDKPHKNLPRLLEAFESLRTRHQEVRLVLVGPISTKLASGRTGVETRGPVADAELVDWYNLARALVLPSLSEGFGLTALEAMACGTPVIGADIPAIREVVGDTGLLVDPRNVDALSAAMARLLADRGHRSTLGEKAGQRARGFTWRRTAEQTLEVYREVACR